MTFFSLIQQVNIDDKIKHAPDNGYLVGVLIGGLLPFVFLSALTYWIYYWHTNLKFKEEQVLGNKVDLLDKNNLVLDESKKIKKIDGDTGWVVFGFILSFLGGWGGIAFGINYLKGKYTGYTKIMGILMILIGIIVRLIISA